MNFWESVWTGAIAGVVAAGVIGVFAWAWRSSRPKPAFSLSREGGAWYLTRVDRSPAINVQWSVHDHQGALVHVGQPLPARPDLEFGQPEVLLYPLKADDQIMVFWGSHDRTNSRSVTIQSGVAHYDVWPVGKGRAQTLGT